MLNTKRSQIGRRPLLPGSLGEVFPFSLSACFLEHGSDTGLPALSVFSDFPTMDWFYSLWEIFLSIEEVLLSLLLEHPFWVLAGLFGIIFLESSICPFLPGDTLLFTAGFALRTSPVSVHTGAGLFLIATALGLTLNYWIGRRLRLRIRTHGLWGITTAQLRRTEHLAERHGVRLIVLGRFLPGVRVVVPLLAGAGQMPFSRFTTYNLLGGVAWIALFVYGGYYFGGLPGVHAYLIPIGILFLLGGLLPVLLRWAQTAWRRAHPQ